MELGLERVARVYQRLGSPRPPRVVTIAGTNGKGTTAHALDYLARKLGWSTARYTSPHLQHFAERVSLDGQPATPAQLCSAFSAVESVRGDTSLSFFEYTTLAAIWLFSQHAPRLCILEVGLGGRLDATNIIDADAVILCSISRDHVEWLGHDLSEIAGEKAAVARAGRPAVLSEPASIEHLRPHLQRIGARQLCADEEWHLQRTDSGQCTLRVAGQALCWQTPAGLSDRALAGALRLLLEWVPAPELAGPAGSLQHLQIPGRCQRQRQAYGERILDVAHNADAINWLRAYLEQLPHMRQWLVLGLQEDKDIAAICSTLGGMAERVFVCSLPPPRGADAASLVVHFEPSTTQAFSTPALAITAAEEQAKQSIDPIRIIICGSFITVGAVSGG